MMTLSMIQSSERIYIGGDQFRLQHFFRVDTLEFNTFRVDTLEFNKISDGHIRLQHFSGGHNRLQQNFKKNVEV